LEPQHFQPSGLMLSSLDWLKQLHWDLGLLAQVARSRALSAVRKLASKERLL
jgi:hypothetical protein